MTHYFLEADGAAHRVDPGNVNLGLAVDVERPDGSRFLVVPVIRGGRWHGLRASSMPATRSWSRRRAANKLAPDDLTGATHHADQPGTLGTTASVPRLMPGQGTIVATGAIRDVGDRRVMTITSTYDHRVIQGAESGAFLRRIEALLGGQDDFYARPLPGARRQVRQRPRRLRKLAREARSDASAPAAGGAAGVFSSDAEPKAVAAAVALVRAYRSFGHLAARLDPLGSRPARRPGAGSRAAGAHTGVDGQHPGRACCASTCRATTLAEALPAAAGDLLRVHRLRGRAHRQPRRAGLAAARDRVRRAPSAAGCRGPAAGCWSGSPHVEGLERFLHRAYLGQKRFSIEGLDVMVPMLDQVLADAAGRGHGRRGDRHGASGPAERAGPHRGRQLRGDPGRVRGRSRRRQRCPRAEGRLRRREVPPRRATALHTTCPARRCTSPSRPTPATWRRSIRWSRAAPAPSRATARRRSLVKVDPSAPCRS